MRREKPTTCCHHGVTVSLKNVKNVPRIREKIKQDMWLFLGGYGVDVTLVGVGNGRVPCGDNGMSGVYAWKNYINTATPIPLGWGSWFFVPRSALFLKSESHFLAVALLMVPSRGHKRAADFCFPSKVAAPIHAILLY